jgi:hypothetical protein
MGCISIHHIRQRQPSASTVEGGRATAVGVSQTTMRHPENWSSHEHICSIATVITLIWPLYGKVRLSRTNTFWFRSKTPTSLTRLVWRKPGTSLPGTSLMNEWPPYREVVECSKGFVKYGSKIKSFPGSFLSLRYRTAILSPTSFWFHFWPLVFLCFDLLFIAFLCAKSSKTKFNVYSNKCFNILFWYLKGSLNSKIK